MLSLLGSSCVKKINRSHTHTRRQRTTPPTSTHTHTTRTTPQPPKPTPPTNTSQRSKVARRWCVPPPTPGWVAAPKSAWELLCAECMVWCWSQREKAMLGCVESEGQ